jgi:hypothetical protein
LTISAKQEAFNIPTWDNRTAQRQINIKLNRILNPDILAIWNTSNPQKILLQNVIYKKEKEKGRVTAKDAKYQLKKKMLNNSKDWKVI